MSIRKPLIFLMVVVATVVLFAATQVAQAADCTLNTSVASDGGSWTLTAVPGPSDADVKTFPYPVDISGKTWYQYDYDLNQHVDHFYLAIPYNCQDPIEIQEIDGVVYKDPAVGDGGWAEGVFTVKLLVIPTESNRISYVADRDVLGEGSAFFSHGKKNYVGQNSIVTVGYQVEEVLTRNFEYDELFTLCVKKELDSDMAIVNLWKACINPNADPPETCPESVSDWGDPITATELDFLHYGGHDLNVKSPGTLEVRYKQDIVGPEGICPITEEEEMSFMDFLEPSVAYAADCVCPPGVKYTSRRKVYCVCP